jgi:DNA-binding response OmpR family regulator
MPFQQKVILVVDDDQDMLNLLNKILTTAGFKVLLANSPSQGRKVITQEVPHLILSDLHMEPENGFQFIQSIKNQKSLESIPILVLSALNDFQSVKKAIGLGVLDYVIKPLQAPMLLGKIKKALFAKDFISWEPEAALRPTVEIAIDAQIVAIGETGYHIEGPFRLSAGKEVTVMSEDFTLLQLDKLRHRSMSLNRIFQSDIGFMNDVTFVGATEGITSKIRQFMSKKRVM